MGQPNSFLAPAPAPAPAATPASAATLAPAPDPDWKKSCGLAELVPESATAAAPVHTEFEDDFFEEPEQEEKRQETETEKFEKGDMSDPSPFCGEECELQYSSCCEYCGRDSPSDDDARSSAGSATTAGGHYCRCRGIEDFACPQKEMARSCCAHLVGRNEYELPPLLE